MVLLAVALLGFLPGIFSIPPIDRDEARFAQATKQMVETGDYIDIRFQDEVRYKKPAGIYWLQAAVVKAASALGVRGAATTIGLYRLPSVLGAIGAVLATYWAALLVSRRAALLAAPDDGELRAPRCRATHCQDRRHAAYDHRCGMGALARAYLSQELHRQRADAIDAADAWLIPAVFWTALAVGVLLKGPLS